MSRVDSPAIIAPALRIRLSDCYGSQRNGMGRKPSNSEGFSCRCHGRKHHVNDCSRIVL
jgi:hypothetical protein